MLANTGTRIGGDRFDEKLSLAAAMPELGYGSLQKGSQSAVAARRGHAIADAVERAKAALSDAPGTTLALDTGSGTLEVGIRRELPEAVPGGEIDRIRDCALEAVRDAGVRPDDIDALFYTGGSSLVPPLRRTVGAPFANARAVHEDAFGSVADGLAIEAGRRAGA